MGRNLADYVRASGTARGGSPALVVGATRLTWAEVDAGVDAAAAGLRAAGLAPGDRVGLLLGNRPEFVLAYFGALRAGLVAVPLNPGYTAPEVGRLLGHAGVGAVVVDRDAAAAARAAGLDDVPRIVVGSAQAGERRFEDVLADGRAAGPVAEPAEPGLALILYTSGTTGEPRGAMLTHQALVASVEQVASLESPIVVPDDVVLGVLPLAHVYSLNGTLAAVARAGAALVLVDRFDPEATLRLVREHGVTNIPGAPAMWVAWAARSDLREALQGVRLLFSGAAALPASVHEQLATATGLPVHEGYGLTEAAPGVSSTMVSGRPKAGSVGQPFPGVEVRLVDEDGEEADDGDPGEIWVRGANLFSGYWPDGQGGPDLDGWYATGDVALFDDDGDLHLVDRRKELIIVSGFNVYPREVEEVIQLDPDVAECAVVGVAHPATGEAVKAYVVPRAGATVTVDAVVAHCDQRLARFKRPTIVQVVETLPHSVMGKVSKRSLRERA